MDNLALSATKPQRIFPVSITDPMGICFLKKSLFKSPGLGANLAWGMNSSYRAASALGRVSGRGATKYSNFKNGKSTATENSNCLLHIGKFSNSVRALVSIFI